MLIAAVSDVHSPRFLLEYTAALSKLGGLCREVKLCLWAGDMVEKGKVYALRGVVDATRARCGCTIISVFGNEEFMGLEDRFREQYREVIWLDDSLHLVTVDGVRIGIVGSRGSLDKPTPWQQKNIPGIESIYSKRVQLIHDLISRAKSLADTVILLTHYAPTYATVEGEPRRIWPMLASSKLEAVVKKLSPNLVIHGHAHRAKKLTAWLGGSLVVNVALPARRRITVIELEPEKPPRIIE